MSEFFTIGHLIDVLLIPTIILGISIISGIIVNRLVNRYLHNDIEHSSWRYIFVNALKGMPLAWFVGVGLYWTINSLKIATSLRTLLANILFALIVLSITRVIARTLVGMVVYYTTYSSSADNMPKTSLLNNIIYILIYSMGALVILQYYGISIAPILTALGVGGMAVALSLQDTLANIFAGIHLILSKQIRINDYIKLSSGEEGRVTDITWRFTTLESVTNNMVIIPNQSIAKSTLTNYSMPQEDLVVVVGVGVSYSSDLELVERVSIETARKVLLRYDKELRSEPAIRFNKFGDSSIDFNVVMHISRYTNQFILKHEFIKALTAEFRKYNIDIPFPIRTIIQADEG